MKLSFGGSAPHQTHNNPTRQALTRLKHLYDDTVHKDHKKDVKMYDQDYDAALFQLPEVDCLDHDEVQGSCVFFIIRMIVGEESTEADIRMPYRSVDWVG